MARVDFGGRPVPGAIQAELERLAGLFPEGTSIKLSEPEHGTSIDIAVDGPLLSDALNRRQTVANDGFASVWRCLRDLLDEHVASMA